MIAEPVVVEQLYHASGSLVWSALTEKDRLRKWYFEVSDFKPEVGFEFHFTAGTDKQKWLHLCKVTEVVPLKKIAYSWRYDRYPGISHVSFELFEDKGKTRVRVTHTGIETFPQDDDSFARSNFLAGWKAILGETLQKYVGENAKSRK